MKTTTVTMAEGPNVQFIHGSSYTGDCTIVYNGKEIVLPCMALIKFAAEVVRSRRISQLEELSYQSLLGIK